MTTLASAPVASREEVILAYHARTKHSLKRYAAGPETLDWDAQPNPFREFEGSPKTPLPLNALETVTSFSQIYTPETVAPAPLSLASVGTLLELSMGLSAWKEYGPDRWALRCNPSSGNLHPTEAYVFCTSVPELDDGLHHYVSRDHSLEHRCRVESGSGSSSRLWIALSSIHWREAWKYGERAFRYCQLDTGHALGAIRYAAGVLGWRATVVDGLDSAALAAFMGLDRAADFAGAEPEDAELLIAIDANPGANSASESLAPDGQAFETGHWAGRANLLDPHPLYRWPVIDQVSSGTRGDNTVARSSAAPAHPPRLPASDAPAAGIILGRRSAQRFDNKFTMSAASFHSLLDALLPRASAPWDVWSAAPSIHPILFVHRVEGLSPGVYALPRHPEAVRRLRKELRPDFEWQVPEGTPSHLPLFRLMPADCRAAARTMNCHQAIASDSCFAVSMLSEFEDAVTENSWRYRQLHWEAGLLGHVLYLESEAAELRGTGIGCYFDDALHEMLGIANMQLQALYHFTVGRPLTDTRITTLPAYQGRQSPNSRLET
jgi:SagB-type dehydrogenase family enzyme